jgi:hypothetical protein
MRSSLMVAMATINEASGGKIAIQRKYHRGSD